MYQRHSLVRFSSPLYVGTWWKWHGECFSIDYMQPEIWIVWKLPDGLDAIWIEERGDEGFWQGICLNQSEVTKHAQHTSRCMLRRCIHLGKQMSTSWQKQVVRVHEFQGSFISCVPLIVVLDCCQNWNCTLHSLLVVYLYRLMENRTSTGFICCHANLNSILQVWVTVCHLIGLMISSVTEINTDMQYFNVY